MGVGSCTIVWVRFDQEYLLKLSVDAVNQHEIHLTVISSSISRLKLMPAKFNTTESSESDERGEFPEIWDYVISSSSSIGIHQVSHPMSA